VLTDQVVGFATFQAHRVQANLGVAFLFDRNDLFISRRPCCDPVLRSFQFRKSLARFDRCVGFALELAVQDDSGASILTIRECRI